MIDKERDELHWYPKHDWKWRSEGFKQRVGTGKHIAIGWACVLTSEKCEENRS